MMNLFLIGFGGIGSRLTPLSKVSDFTHIHIYDNDTYESGNETRQGASILEGRKKAEVGKGMWDLMAPHDPTVRALSEEKFQGAIQTNDPTVIFCTVDNAEGRCAVHRWAREPAENIRPPDIVLYGMNELENGEAVLDLPAVPWWPDPAKLYPRSFYEGLDAAQRPHCTTLQEQGGTVAEQTATINATVAGDMMWLFEAARHLQRNPRFMTERSLEIPLPHAVVTTALVKRTLRIYSGGDKVT